MGLHRCFEVVEVCLHGTSVGLNSLLGGPMTMEDLRGRLGQVGCDPLSREVLLSTAIRAVGVTTGRCRGG